LRSSGAECTATNGTLISVAAWTAHHAAGCEDGSSPNATNTGSRRACSLATSTGRGAAWINCWAWAPRPLVFTDSPRWGPNTIASAFTASETLESASLGELSNTCWRTLSGRSWSTIANALRASPTSASSPSNPRRRARAGGRTRRARPTPGFASSPRRRGSRRCRPPREPVRRSDRAGRSGPARAPRAARSSTPSTADSASSRPRTPGGLKTPGPSPSRGGVWDRPIRSGWAPRGLTGRRARRANLDPRSPARTPSR
jgi:hypothetical protein